jgi:hypothetical protein
MNVEGCHALPFASVSQYEVHKAVQSHTLPVPFPLHVNTAVALWSNLHPHICEGTEILVSSSLPFCTRRGPPWLR